MCKALGMSFLPNMTGLVVVELDIMLLYKLYW